MKVEPLLRQKEVMRTFPKVELHRHLEGTFELSTLHTIALRNDLPYPQDFEAFKPLVQFPRDSEPDFLRFLSKFKNDWYRSHQDVSDIAYASIRDIAREGMFYLELRFSPEHFALQNDFDRMEMTRLVIDAGNRAAADGGFRIKYLITFNRGKQNQHEMLALYESIVSLDIPEIVGIDLAGDETQYPPELFPEFFSKVRTDRRFGITIHAGEVTPADQIWKAIELLHADRIGHGTSSIDDPKLQEHLTKHGIVLEQCITSNYQTGSWVDEPNHPLGALYRNGVPVTINSDDPSIQDTDLTDDYVKASQYFDLSVDDLVSLNLIAIEGAFLSKTDKKALRDDYMGAVAAFRQKHGLA